jgi:serine/threonine-protein kinase ATR
MSAKIARKAGQWQTAYNATLQAQQRKATYSFIESAKLLKASGEPLRALHDLENSVKHEGLFDDNVLDLTMDTDSERMKAKVRHTSVYEDSIKDIYPLDTTPSRPMDG